MLNADLLTLSWDEGPHPASGLLCRSSWSPLCVKHTLRQLFHRHTAQEDPRERRVLILRNGTLAPRPTQQSSCSFSYSQENAFNAFFFFPLTSQSTVCAVELFCSLTEGSSGS